MHPYIYLDNCISHNVINNSFRFNNIKAIKLWIAQTFINENTEFSYLIINICEDAYLLELNQKVLNHNSYTDIITFSYNETEERIEGELYISIDRVKENAKQFKVKYREELNRVIIHGVLHLCGYNDKTMEEREGMRKKEDFYLLRYKDSSLVSRGT